jgi:hypothetical protein
MEGNMALPTDPKLRRISTDTPLAWGKLVKSWATGRDYVKSPPYPRPPVDSPPAHVPPKDFNDFVAQCEGAGVSLVYGDGTTVSRADAVTLQVISHNTDTLVIRLSPTAFIEESEDQIVKAGGYPVTPFYGYILLDASAKIGETDTEVKRLNIHAMRVGEYTIAMCQ